MQYGSHALTTETYFIPFLFDAPSRFIRLGAFLLLPIAPPRCRSPPSWIWNSKPDPKGEK